MREQLLTARDLYRFMNVGIGSPQVSIPLFKDGYNFTQAGFWWSFLSEGIPESAITPYFYTGRGRPRALSNLMNRTVSHSMPRKLYHTMEEHLTPDNFLHVVIWLTMVPDENINGVVIHEALTELEERICRNGCDNEFRELYSFFVSLRPNAAVQDASNIKKLFMHAMMRFSMLGFHALYGDMMIESSALSRLRASRVCDPEMLWEAAAAVVPRVKEGLFSFQKATEMRRQDAEACPAVVQDDRALREAVAAAALNALPPGEVRLEHTGPNAGWYVVANWMDFCVNVNDTPRSTYVGARELDTMPNGTLIYVLSAPGYRGMHVSSGVWGKILWKGEIAWVPMNLLVRLDGGNAAPTAVCK